MAEYQFQTRGNEILVGLSVEGAMLDALTTKEELLRCAQVLEWQKSLRATEHTRFGGFGSFTVTLNVPNNDNRVSLFIDGPKFDNDRAQSAAIWIDGAKLLEIVRLAIATLAQRNN